MPDRNSVVRSLSDCVEQYDVSQQLFPVLQATAIPTVLV
jgi:hypothetical protein